MIKRILLGLGGTPFTDVAIERAVELAKGHDALITGVTVVDTKQLAQVGPVPLGGGRPMPQSFANSALLSLRNGSRKQSKNLRKNVKNQISQQK